MELNVAQNDMAIGHVGGAPGALVSGLVWLVSGSVWFRMGVDRAFAVLFVGGMFIVPVALLIARLLVRAPRTTPGNPLERLGLESTFLLFACLVIAYGLLRVSPAAVFPILAITIGARYFVFRTIYGEPFYWLLAALIMAAGAAAYFRLVAWPGNLAFVVGAIEVLGAMVLFIRRRGSRRNDRTAG